MLTTGFSSDNVQDGIPPMPYTPSYELDAFSTVFDEPISYQTNMFDAFLDDSINIPDAAPTEMDNGKLLGFGAPVHKTPLFDQSGQTWPRMSAELNGMFSVAEDVFEGDAAGRPLELTCYRRNLFQISGTIALSRTASQVLLDQCRRVPIYDLVATLSATESIEGKSTDIIAVPWKTGSLNGASSEEKNGTAPADIQIDLLSNQETDPMFVSIPIAWGRLQFKNATANNGRRKGLQQHYRIQVTLMAKLEGDGQPVKLAEIQSNPIVVRGRSPKNFDSSTTVPLSERKAESGNRMRGNSVANTPQWIEPAFSQSQKFYAAKSVQVCSLKLRISIILSVFSLLVYDANHVFIASRHVKLGGPIIITHHYRTPLKEAEHILPIDAAASATSSTDSMGQRASRRIIRAYKFASGLVTFG